MDYRIAKIRNFPLAVRIARAVRVAQPHRELVELARALFEAHIGESRPFEQATLAFLSVCYAVDDVKVKTIGRAAPTETSNLIQTLAGEHLVARTNWDDSDIRSVDGLAELFGKSGSSLDRWAAVKLSMLREAMTQVRDTRAFAEQARLLKPFAVPAPVIQHFSDVVTGVGQLVRDLMEQLLELRRYGIKSSILDGGGLSREDAALVIWDFHDFSSGVLPSSSDTIAQIALATSASQITTIVPEYVPGGDGSMIDRILLPFPAAFSWAFKKNAEFELGGTRLGVLPVRSIFKKAGKEWYYECIRLQAVLHLYDLIVPLTKIRELPASSQLFRSPTGIGKILAILKPSKSSVADLILPRVKLLEARASVESDLQEEVERAEEDTRQRALRKHDVVEHIRKLPRGHRPSPMARHLALQTFGIVLAENETFVRKHKRGSGSEITAHRVKMRGERIIPIRTRGECD